MSVTERILMDPKTRGIWVNGKERPGAAGTTMEVINPYDDSIVGAVALGSVSDVDAAVGSAETAWRDGLGAMPAHEKVTALRRVATGIHQEADQFVDTIVAESGKPIRDAEREVGRAVRLFEMAAEQLSTMDRGSVLPLDVVASGVNRFGYTTRVPMGVIAAIVPSNSPLNLAANKIAPALAMGNAVVLKPADQTPFSVLRLARIAQDAGFPAGALNVVIGTIEDVATPMITDERVRMVTATGGLAMGQAIARSAGLKKLTLELGSSAANIVCSDADIPFAARSLATSAYLSSGQACISAQRLIVHHAVAAEFVATFVKAAEAMVIGDPRDPATEIGPMLSASSVERLMSWIDEACSRGAKLLTGGERYQRTIRPTLVTDVPASSRLGCDEAFGPVATLARFSELEEAIGLANATQYGLQAGVFTSDIGTALKCAREIDVGALWVNDSSRYRQDNYPFGGRKHSGLGREGVRYAMEEMSELRFVGIRLGPSGGILG